MSEMREKILSCTGGQPILMAALIMLCSTCLSIVVCVVRSSKHNRPFSGNKKKEKAKSSESTAKSDKNNNNNFQLKLFRKLARNSPPNRPQELCVEETNREVYKERLRSAALAKQATLCIGTSQHDMRVSVKVEAQKPTNHTLVPSSVHVDQKTSNLSVDNTLFIGRTVKSRTCSPDQKNRLDSATRDDDGNVKLIEGETMVPLQVPPNANHGLLPSLTVEELADFHRERRELICRFEAKRLELREDRRKRGLPSKHSTTSSSGSDPLSTSSGSNGEVFPPPLSLKEQQVIESTATSTTPMPLTPSIVSASLHTSSLNSTLAGISSLRLLNEDVLSPVPLTAYSSKKNYASSSSSSGASSGKTTIFTFQSDIIQTSDGSKASSKGGNEDNRDGGRSRPPVTSVELPASLGSPCKV